MIFYAFRYLLPQRFDLAINPRRDTDWYYGNVLAYFSGAPKRVGYTDPRAHVSISVSQTSLNSLLNVQIQNDIGSQHEVVHNLELLKYVGVNPRQNHLEVWRTAEDEIQAELQMRFKGSSDGHRIIAIALSAGDPKKAWPVDRFIDVALGLLEKCRVRFVLIGAAEALDGGAIFCAKIGDYALNLIGKTTLCQTAAVLSRCSLYLGNDTGPMHMAAAVSVPVVELCCFPKCGSSKHVQSPARFGPWGVTSIILQPDRPVAPCLEGCVSDRPHCINQIDVQTVLSACLELLKSQ